MGEGEDDASSGLLGHFDGTYRSLFFGMQPLTLIFGNCKKIGTPDKYKFSATSGAGKTQDFF